jgi:hypothetical protein
MEGALEVACNTTVRLLGGATGGRFRCWAGRRGIDGLDFLQQPPWL